MEILGNKITFIIQFGRKADSSDILSLSLSLAHNFHHMKSQGNNKKSPQRGQTQSAFFILLY